MGKFSKACDKMANESCPLEDSIFQGTLRSILKGRVRFCREVLRMDLTSSIVAAGRDEDWYMRRITRNLF